VGKNREANDTSKDKSQVSESGNGSFDRYSRSSTGAAAGDGLNALREFYEYRKELSTRQLGDEVSRGEAVTRQEESNGAAAAGNLERKRASAANLGRAVRLPASANVTTSAGAKSTHGSDIEA